MSTQLGVASQRLRFLERVMEVLAASGYRERSQEPAVYAEIALLNRIGERLGEVLQGQLQPLPRLFPGGSAKTAAYFYPESPSFRWHNVRVGRVIRTAMESVGAGRPVRILEIGHGTGGTTAHVLPSLPAEQIEFWFTVSEDPIQRILVAKSSRLLAAPPTSQSLTQVPTINWLILADQGGVARHLLERLQAQGDRGWVVSPAAGFAVTGNYSYAINPTERDELERLFGSIRQEP
jgi:hypothetical protein